MAVDEAVLLAVEAGKSPPTLRFYRWMPPAVSLGFGQALARSVDEDLLAEKGIDLVRRPTGGKAVLHDDEVTYSLAARHDGFPAGSDLLDTYRTLAEAFASGLGRLGIEASLVPRKRGSLRSKTPVCFEVPASYELVVESRKVLGSAQRRTRQAFLQHGSLPLRLDLPLLYRCLHPGKMNEKEDALVARWRGEMAGLCQAVRQSLEWDSIVEAIVEGVEECLGVTCRKEALSDEEIAAAQSLVSEKYGNPAWTRRR